MQTYPPLPFVTQQPTYLFPIHHLATYPLSTSPPLSPCSPITDALSPFPLFTYSAKGNSRLLLLSPHVIWFGPSFATQASC